MSCMSIFFPSYHLIFIIAMLSSYIIRMTFCDINIQSHERQALYDLYTYTNGNDWIYKEGDNGHWNFSDPNVNPCESTNKWQGLNCSISNASSLSSTNYYYISDILLSGYNLNGILPDSIGNFVKLQRIDVSYNFIMSSIPTTVGNLSELLNLDLSDNLLNKTLPSSLYKLFKLKNLHLENNFLSGTICNSLSQLEQLKHINLRDNFFNGTIPYSIGNLSQLVYLRISRNYFSRTIPNNLRYLSSLSFLSVSYNLLTGTIPTWFGELSNLQFLNLSANNFNGTIPNSLANLTRMSLFSLGNNSYTGTIPSFIGHFSELKELSLYKNYFTGTIPTSFSNLRFLSFFVISYNLLDGSLPAWIGNLSELTVLNLYNNHFTGYLPPTITKLTKLEFLSIGNNHLTGTITNDIGALINLTELGLSRNCFTGTIPSTIANLASLQLLYLQFNLFSGKIPDIFHNLSNLTTAEFENNDLIETIPLSVSKLFKLKRFFVQNNRLSGDLDDVFNGRYQTQLRNIQLSNNQFTGKLPEQVFLSGSLHSFSAVSNCFHGSIPTSICTNKYLETLALDGLVCASSCRNKIFPGISSAYLSERKITGGIPHCLWSMPNLQVLHLSGNSLTGSLPDNINISTSLIDLSLSHNILTGNIPSYMQEKSWNSLDLSHNRISGTLRSNYARQSTNASLSLNNNRLSGNIPHHLKDMRNISILEGNYYTCSYDRSELPSHDSEVTMYDCGSNTFNIMYYIWSALFVITSVILVVLFYCNNINHIEQYKQLVIIVQKVRNWIQVINNIDIFECDESLKSKLEAMKYFKRYNHINDKIFKFSLYCTAFIMIIFTPVYIILGRFYGTHALEYAWSVSIVYLSGEIAFGVIMSLLLIFIMLQIFMFRSSLYSNSTDTLTTIEYSSSNEVYKKSTILKIWIIYLLYIFINFVIVTGAYVAYVYIALYESNNVIVIAQISLALFKLTWNNIISPKMISIIIYYFNIWNATSRRFQRSLFLINFIVSLFNNIIIPCVVVIVISPSCFYYVFSQESDVSSSFSYIDCSIYIGKICAKLIVVESATSYSPPFSYSYSCSSDFITTYSPLIIYLCIASTFIIPILEISLIKLSKQFYWMSMLTKFRNLLFLSIDTKTFIEVNEIYHFLTSQLTWLGLLLTFGIAFPLLAISILVTIASRLYYHKAVIGRFLLVVIESKSYLPLDILEEDCKALPLLATIQSCGWLLLSLCCCFYSFFLFDILGDKVGVYRAYWVLIVIPCLPICIYIFHKMNNQYLIPTIQKSDSVVCSSTHTDIKTDSNTIELTSNPLIDIIITKTNDF